MKREKLQIPIIIALTSLSICSILGLFSKEFYFFEILVQFNHFYLIAAIALLPVIFLISKNMIKIWLLIIIAYQSYFVFPLYSGNSIDNESPVSINILHANILSSNTNYKTVLDQLISEDADIIGIQEVNTFWADTLNHLKQFYPYYKIIPRLDNFGIALFSKIPLNGITIVPSPTYDLPMITADLELNDKKIGLFYFHLIPPIKGVYQNERIAVINSINKLIEKSNEVIVWGDFNSSSWSPTLSEIINNHNLHPAAKGNGINSTWPSSIPLLPLDQILLSKGLQSVSYKTLTIMGSDHKAIQAQVVLR